jgi:dipeptidyl aminopeptidase/acylaminoacyl peptidase
VLSPGTRLGPYEILAPIGAGGMGEVYRARDARLNRDVAVKVLPPTFTRDPDRLSRFLQEARAAAALNHPAVIAVFDVDVEGDTPYLVSELLDGETLRAAIARGAMSQKKAVDLAVQVAAGMGAAHAKGIVHRDLKPDNIFVTADGRAKILDFGLARLLAPQANPSLAQTLAMTSPGMLLGTVGYMSPEQVRGDAADHRSDIFAFGAVFYEMLAGQPPFTGPSAVETMNAILQRDPPELPPGTAAPPLERIARRCLEKVPAERFQSASDVGFALQAMSWATTAPTTAPGTARAGAGIAAPRRWRPATIGAAVAVVAAIAAAVAMGARRARDAAPSPAGVMSFEARTFDRLPITNARFMPDGQTIVYSAAPRGYLQPDLFVISPSAEAPQPLGVSRAHLLSVSSRGELALIADAKPLDQRLYSGTLARMTLGSSPRAIMENVREADWAPDGAALAIVHDLGNGRDRLEYPIGTPLHEVSGYLSDPRVSPDGSRVAFFEHQWRFDDRGWVKVVDRAGAVTTVAGELWGLQGLAWTPDGATIVFSGNAVGGSVMQPMSAPASGSAPARPVFGVPGRFIVHDVAPGGRWLAVREDLALGVRASVPGQATEQDLSWLGSSGARALSSDGAWLLMVDVGLRSGPEYGVVLRRTDGSQPIRLGVGNPHRLSPDGKWAAAMMTTPPGLVMYPTGSGEPRRLKPGPIERLTSVEWFPDGRRLLVCGSEGARAPRCYAQDLVGSAPTPITPEGVLATLAPDGRTLLLTVQNGSRQVSSIDGGLPRPVTALRPEDRPIAWSRDNQSVYVQRGLEVPAIVDRVGLTTGTRAVVRQLMPEGIGAIASISVTDWVDDGRWYAYNYTSLTSTLFLVTNVID